MGLARACVQRVFLFRVSRPAAIARARAGSDDYIPPGTQLVCTNKTFTFPPGTVLLLLLVLVAAAEKGRDVPPLTSPFFPATLPSAHRRHRRQDLMSRNARASREEVTRTSRIFTVLFTYNSYILYKIYHTRL